jgi:hypothetical protein
MVANPPGEIRLWAKVVGVLVDLLNPRSEHIFIQHFLPAPWTPRGRRLAATENAPILSENGGITSYFRVPEVAVHGESLIVNQP